jgi:hypothetical protein
MKFLERRSAASFFDRTGHTLRKKQPPRSYISVPGVDDHIDLLVEQISFDDGDRLRCHFKSGRRNQFRIHQTSSRLRLPQNDPNGQPRNQKEQEHDDFHQHDAAVNDQFQFVLRQPEKAAVQSVNGITGEHEQTDRKQQQQIAEDSAAQ